MKRLLAAWCFLVLVVVFDANALFSSEKKQPRVVSVQGQMPYSYQIVETTIMYNPTKGTGQQSSKPIVTRSVRGQLKRGQNTSVLIDALLRVPKNAVQSDRLQEVTEAATKIAGACDPRAGMAAGAASVLLDVGMEVAGDVLTSVFGDDPLTLTLIEILPTQYYRIDEGTGLVVVTEYFKQDLERYNQLFSEYVGVAQRWNEVIARYNANQNEWLTADPMQADQKRRDQLAQQYETSVKPALREKLRIELQLQNYALHRMSIMAVNTPEGRTCGQNGAGSGPWRLYVYYFIGAKQTNIFGVDYCVPSRTSTQDFVVQLVPNAIDKQAGFKPGGVKLVASGTRPNITFPRQVSAGGRVNYAAPETNVFSWFDEMIVKEAAAGYDSYLFPFDILAMRNEYAAMLAKQRDERSKARLDLLDTAIALVQSASGRRELETSRQSGSLRCQTDLAGRTSGGRPENRDEQREQSVLLSMIGLGVSALDRVYKEVTSPVAEQIRNAALAIIGKKSVISSALTEQEKQNWEKMVSDVMAFVQSSFTDAGIEEACQQLRTHANQLMSALTSNYEQNIAGKPRPSVYAVESTLVAPARRLYKKNEEVKSALEQRGSGNPRFSESRKALVLLASWMNSVIQRIDADFIAFTALYGMSR